MLTLILGAALALQAQDEPFETRIYNVEFLTREVEDRPGTDVSLFQDSIGVTVSADSELSRGLLTGDDLVSLIRNNVAEDTWEHEKASIRFEGGLLTVTNRRSVQEKIGQYLAYWRGFFGKMITVEAAIISVDPRLLARLRAAGAPNRPMVLAPEPLKALLEAAREEKDAELLKSMRVTAHPGQRVNLKDVQKQAYVRDVDAQIATASVALDPILDVLQSGTVVDVRPYLEPFGNAVTIEVRVTRADVEAVTERKLRLSRDINLAAPIEVPGEKGPGIAADPRRQAMSAPAEPRLELPRLAVDRFRTTLTVRSRETAIAGSAFREGRNVLLLLTPAILSLDERPAPEPEFEEQRLLRMYDISPLTRRFQDWAGPRLGLVNPYWGGGALVGATFTMDEPRGALVADESIAELLRTRIAPDTWGNRRNSITIGPNGALLVRQKPEVLREIDRFLDSLYHLRAQMVTCEAILVGFRKNARAGWEKQVPALAPGGYFVDREPFDRLFQEACGNGNVRLIEMAEITGFPQQRVHMARLVQEAVVADYEPQVATCVSTFDPIIDTVASGFVLDVRPHFVQGTERIAVSLQAALTRHDLREIDAVAPSAGPLQAARGPESRWESDVLCVRGKVTLVGIFSRGRGEEAEEVALFLRARANLLEE